MLLHPYRGAVTFKPSKFNPNGVQAIAKSPPLPLIA
jgi:hypothetical protein